jgi:hypothetical protein
MMRRLGLVTVLAGFVAACGGDDSGMPGDAAATDGPLADSATMDGSTADAPGGPGPGTGSLSVTMSGTKYSSDAAAYSGSPDNAVSAFFPDILGPNISITWTGTATGSFTQVGGGMRISWQQPPNGNTWWCDQYTAGSSCTLDVDPFGDQTGDEVTGIFSGTVARFTGSDGPDSFEVMNGSFTVQHP